MSNEIEKVERVYRFMDKVKRFLIGEFDQDDGSLKEIVFEAQESKRVYEDLNEVGQLEILSSMKKGLTEIFTIYINMIDDNRQEYSEDNLDVLYLNNEFPEMFELIDSMHIDKVSKLTERLTISEDEKLLLDDILTAAEMYYREVDRLYLDGYETQLAKETYADVEAIVKEYHCYNDDVRLKDSSELLLNVINMCEQYGYNLKNHDEENELKETLLRAYFSSCALKEMLMFKHLGE